MDEHQEKLRTALQLFCRTNFSVRLEKDKNWTVYAGPDYDKSEIISKHPEFTEALLLALEQVPIDKLAARTIH